MGGANKLANIGIILKTPLLVGVLAYNLRSNI